MSSVPWIRIFSMNHKKFGIENEKKKKEKIMLMHSNERIVNMEQREQE